MAKKIKDHQIKTVLQYKGNIIPMEELDDYPEAKEEWFEYVASFLVPIALNMLNEEKNKKISKLNKTKIIEIITVAEKKQIAKQVLDDLLEWFGIPEYTENYIEKSSEMPFLAVYVDGIIVGFAALKKTSGYTSEIFCMGIVKKHHRKGLGQQLYFELEKHAKKLGYKYMQVKTVETGRYIEYDKTNAFYKSVGFCELEVFPKLWDEQNPCQVYVKAI